jgi:phage replication-related protein YjqB (UPF0714/DUF867 family)
MAAQDKYRNFNQLQKAEQADAYRIVAFANDSKIAIIAPHAGGIEPGTSELARAIAGSDLSLYLFEGRKADHNRDLHITSTNFDEPSGVALVRQSTVVIALHGEKDEEHAIAYIGGRDAQTAGKIRAQLEAAGFDVRTHESAELQGTHPDNICNGGVTSAGVQLELSKALRLEFFPSLQEKGRAAPRKRFYEFANAIRLALGVPPLAE